jgi:hypothetical protein
LTGKNVKTRVIYFIGTAGPVVHDDNKFFEYTVIGVAVFDDLNVDHLWMTFGKGKDL